MGGNQSKAAAPVPWPNAASILQHPGASRSQPNAAPDPQSPGASRPQPNASPDPQRSGTIVIFTVLGQAHYSIVHCHVYDEQACFPSNYSHKIAKLILKLA